MNMNDLDRKHCAHSFAIVNNGKENTGKYSAV